MILFPAIDLKDGACVRLVRGEMDQSTTFNDDPAAQARDFAAAGFEWIHIVDLVGIDARGGRVAVEGWAETSDTRALDLAMRFENDGVAAIVYTDIDRDGAMQGVNIDATVDLAFALTTPVIASGGVRGLSDIADLKAHESAGIEGVISGRAIYDGRLDAARALALLRG